MSNSNLDKFTEEDTYKRLVRPTIDEMFSMFKNWKYSRVNAGAIRDTRLNIKFVNEHNWDWVEFLKACKNKGYQL